MKATWGSDSKYGPLSERLTSNLDAGAVIIVVIGGARGTGFAITSLPEYLKSLPDMLRNMANHIEQGDTETDSVVDELSP